MPGAHKQKVGDWNDVERVFLPKKHLVLEVIHRKCACETLKDASCPLILIFRSAVNALCESAALFCSVSSSVGQISSRRWSDNPKIRPEKETEARK